MTGDGGEEVAALCARWQKLNSSLVTRVEAIDQAVANYDQFKSEPRDVDQ